MRKPTRYTLLAIAAAVLLLGVLIVLEQRAPPEAARLLPESDAIVFVSLKPLRAATHFDRNPPTRSASYQQFIDATGIVAERDLDTAAFALHRMPDPGGPNGPIAFSEVLQGHFDTPRLTRYLLALSGQPGGGTEAYGGRTIYTFPSEGRTVRVAILSYDTVAGSNTPTPEQIHSILDRARAAASPFAGSSLLSSRFTDVPAFSTAWAVGRLALPFGNAGHVQLMGLELPIPPDATFVASVRYSGALHLRIEEIAANPTEAETTAAALTQLLGLVRTLQLTQQPTPRTPEDQVLHTALEATEISQHKDRAVLTTTIPAESLRRLAPR